MDTAVNAIQAWTVASRHPPDAVILDIQMPNGSGYAVLKQMKSSNKTMGVPVIVLSGSIDSSDKVKLKELGADEFLSKPVDVQQLLATLSAVLHQPMEDPPEATDAAAPHFPGLGSNDLLKYVEGDVSLLQELAATFWKTCPQMVADVRKALEDKSPKSLERAAHSLKGSLGYFGTTLALPPVQKLEVMGREGTLEGAEELFAEMEKGLSALKVALDSFEASLRSGK